MQTIKLGDVAEFQEGYVNPKQTNNSYFDGPIKWLRAVDLINSTVFSTTRTLTKKGFESAGKSAYLFPPDSLAISKSGTIGRVGILKDWMCGNRAVINIKPNESIANKKYLFYCLLLGRPQIERLAEGSVQKNLYISELSKFEIPLPILEIQNKIANILGTLDEKIELNKKTNETLEGIAKSLFKSWFIDFDPVKAKVDGRSIDLPDEISDLFPDSFEDSELGQIPKGWVVANLGDCSLQIESGKRPKGGINKELQNGIPSIGAESIDSTGIFDFSKTKFVTHDFASSSKKGWVKNLDVALYKDGGKPGEFKPRVAIYGENYPFNSFMVNEHVFLIRSEMLGQPFLYHLMNSHLIKEQIIQMGSSKAAQPGLNQEEVKSTFFPKSNNMLTSKFNKISIPIIKKQLTLGKQNIYLENLRNAILPKLISGELKIPDTEKMIEEAGV